MAKYVKRVQEGERPRPQSKRPQPPPQSQKPNPPANQKEVDKDK